MPSSTITYYPSSTYWQTARKIIESGIKAYPLSGAPSHFTIEDRYAIKPASYSRLALDTAHAVETSAYLVDEQHLRKSPAFIYFRRLYATIPADHAEPESSTFSFPGYDATVSAGALKTITAYNSSTKVFTSTAHGFVDGDVISYSIKQDNIAGTVWITNGTGVVADKTTDTFKISGLRLISQTFDSGAAFKVGTNPPPRDPLTSVAEGKTMYEYFLPGVTSGITTVDDIKAVPLFTPVDADGSPVDTLTSTTSPTAAAYLASVIAGEFLAVESFVERYLGNIYRRVTRYVRAT